MAERIEELVTYKARALTAEVHRMAGEAERRNGELRAIREGCRGAVESFETVRRRTRDTGQIGDPRLGRFYVEALQARLILERRVVRKLEERLADAELRAASAHRDMSTAMARLRRLQEITTELRSKGAAERERRVEELLHEVWWGRSRWNRDEFERNDDLLGEFRTECRGDEGGANTPLIDGRTEDTSRTDTPCSRGFAGAATESVRFVSRGESNGRFDSERVVGAGHAPHVTVPLVGGGMMAGVPVSQPMGEPSPPSTLHATAAPVPRAVGQPLPVEIASGGGTTVESRTDGGIAFTYRGGSGSAIEVGIVRAPSGAIELAFNAERPGDRYRLERERRGLIDSLKERGYEVERCVIRGARREVKDGGRR